MSLCIETKEFTANQELWLMHVRSGKSLELVPLQHRSEKVCFYATFNMPFDRTSPTFVEGSFQHQMWKETVMPFIPVDVLMTMFVRGGVCFEMDRQRDLEYMRLDRVEAELRMKKAHARL